MAQPAQPTPLIPPSTRVSRKRLGLACLVLTLAGGALLFYKLQEQQASVGPRRDREIPEATAEGALPSTASELRRPGSYAGLSVIPAQEPIAPPQPTTQVVQAQVVQTENPFVEKKQPTSQGQQNGQRRANAAGGQPTPKAANKWLFAKTAQGEQVQKPPFETKEDIDEEKGKDAKASALFPKATWAIPDDPTRTLYRSQILSGILQQDISTQQPGTVQILLTEEVQDRFSQGHVLLPQYTLLLGSQDAAVKRGQNRVAISIDTAELPDGTVLSLNKAKAGDETGATGVKGSVDNHYVQLGIGAVLSAALSVGSRNVGGSTRGFNPTLEQQYLNDISQDVNRTGQKIVGQFADIAPEITIPHGTPVTVMLDSNISLQTQPIVIKK
jgi:type IV secretory pathway VirB10-like protein